MAYLGKEFKVVKEENYDEFIKSLQLPEEDTAKYIAYKPTTKLEKDGDTYKSTATTPAGAKVTTFKSGVEFEEEVRPGLTIKSKYTVDGDTITQEITRDGKTATFKREYKDNELTVTITANFWDGKAVRYYKA
ncbi:hypothetical protein ABMA28_008846 [Loxostege sticticalis]|uniref:Fatty acid binding protein n=1 Tax=Loxostege sticticalis TaxID=481309 RepID=A0ABD0SH21_LOXSC